MPWFEGTHTETRPLSADAATVIAHLHDTQKLIAATKGVEEATVEDGVVHFVMEEEDHGVVKFKGDFRCRYEATADGLIWTSLEGGNLDQSGSATVVAKGDGCELHYTETVRIDLGVPKMMAPMLKPVIGPMMAMEVKDFVKRLTAPLQ
jgi:carbon monoxide dehydrogenase subunit G